MKRKRNKDSHAENKKDYSQEKVQLAKLDIKAAEAYLDVIVDNISLDDLKKGEFLSSEKLTELFTTYLGSRNDPRISLAQFLVDAIFNKSDLKTPFMDFPISDFDFVKMLVGRVTSRPALLMKLLPYLTGKKNISSAFSDGSAVSEAMPRKDRSIVNLSDW